ncbi:hypothetical protein L218DRAFT_829653, partial [Marasmius fiardii PR-910]
RIWSISREARQLMGQSTDTRYKSLVAIIIESGAIYAACILGVGTYDLAFDTKSHGLVAFDFGPVVTLISGLAPTLIIVRVARGQS